MTRRKDGLLQEKIFINGVPKYFYGHTKSEVLRKIREFREAEERGALLVDVADKWWAEHEPTISPNTVGSYKRPLARIKEYFAGRYIKEITTPDVALHLKSMIAKYDMAQKTASNHLTVLSRIFNYAIVNGYAQINPTRELEVPKKLKKTKRTGATSDDIKRIKDSADLDFGLFALFAMYTGLRKGEILALTWDDIDLDNRIIRVTKSLLWENNRPQIKPPKTEMGIRTVAIPDKLAEHIKPSKGIIFCDDDGNYITGSQYRDRYKAYQAASGVTCTAHQLRHTYATMLFELGIDVKDAQRLLGHAQSSTTQDIYTDIRENRVCEINRQMRSADIC